MSKSKYSIKDLENFTQIKAHTIRIWEQRYGLLQPSRTNTNIRYYDENDLKKILNINLLYNSGYKISKIAQLSENEIRENAKSIILNSTTEYHSDIDQLILLILDFNGSKIEEFINENCANTNLLHVYQNLFLPLFQKIGELWQVDAINIIHEHYFSNIFRQFLIAEIHSLKLKKETSKNALLFLHDSEEHEFSILIYYYILKLNGFKCHYLGQKTPINEVESAVDQIKPDVVVTTFTTKISSSYSEKIANLLINISKRSRVIVSGNQLENMPLQFSNELLKIETIDQLSSVIKEM